MQDELVELVPWSPPQLADQVISPMDYQSVAYIDDCYFSTVNLGKECWKKRILNPDIPNWSDSNQWTMGTSSCLYLLNRKSSGSVIHMEVREGSISQAFCFISLSARGGAGAWCPERAGASFASACWTNCMNPIAAREFPSPLHMSCPSLWYHSTLLVGLRE